MLDKSKGKIERWSKIASVLGLDIETGVVINIAGADPIRCPVLVKNFGHTKGMLIFNTSDEINDMTEQMIAAGYGYSVMPSCSPENINYEGIKEVLCDWGWSGPENLRPSWYKEVDDEPDA